MNNLTFSVSQGLRHLKNKNRPRGFSGLINRQRGANSLPSFCFQTPSQVSCSAWKWHTNIFPSCAFNSHISPRNLTAGAAVRRFPLSNVCLNPAINVLLYNPILCGTGQSPPFLHWNWSVNTSLPLSVFAFSIWTSVSFLHVASLYIPDTRGYFLC